MVSVQSLVFFAIQNGVISIPTLLLSHLVTHGIIPRLTVYVSYYLIGMYGSVFVPGILGQMSPLGVVLGSLFSGTLLLGLAIYQKNVGGLQVLTSQDTGSPKLEWLGSFRRYQNLILVASLGLLLWLSHRGAIQFWVLLSFLVHPLISWDVVSYHLPNAVNYLQAESLWPITGVFSQYPGGSEVLNLWSMIPFRTDIFIGLTSAALTLMLFLVVTAILQRITSQKHPFITMIILFITYSILLSQPFLLNMLFSLARNDLALMVVSLFVVWVTMQLTLELRAAPVPGQQRSFFWPLTLGLLLGLAISIKPTGLMLLLSTLVFVGIVYRKQPRSHAIRVLGLILSSSVLLGGFWYLRNVITQGSLISSDVADSGLKLSIIYNLFNPDFYSTQRDLLLYGGSWIVGVFSLLMILFSRQKYRDPLLLTVIYFHWVMGLGLLITPYAASVGTQGGDSIIYAVQLRYSMGLMPLSLLLLVYWLVLGGSWLADRFGLKASFVAASEGSPLLPRPQSIWPMALTLHAVIVGIVGLQLVSYDPPQGLPNYQKILFGASRDTPASQVYEWVHTHLNNTTIYSFGLRPYGLYGFPYSNRVIEHQGIPSHSAIRAGFLASNAQYLVMSRDPFTGQFPAEAERFVQELRLLYQDPLAVVFAAP
ncbi:MAG: hypothetical protein OHK0012_26710 [Synechococcales cyanobacterium]